VVRAPFAIWAFGIDPENCGSGWQGNTTDRGVDKSISVDILKAMSTVETTRQGAAKLFHALSDPTRLEILERLRGGERCVCDLQGALDAAQSRLSFHLRTLRDAGLVSDRKDGRWVYYSLRPEAIEELARALGDLTVPKARAVGEWYSCCG